MNIARPTEIVERLVINPDSSSNAEFPNSLTQVQDGSDARLEVPAVASGERRRSPSVGAASLPGPQVTTVLRKDYMQNRLDLTEEDQAFAGELNQPEGLPVVENAISIREEIVENIQTEQPGRPPISQQPELNEEVQQL